MEVSQERQEVNGVPVQLRQGVEQLILKDY